MALGMNIVVPAPRPAPRMWATAITTYVQLEGPEYEPDARGVKRWLNGVKFIPFGCDKIVGDLFDPCVERTTEYSEMGDEVSFDPFLAETAVQCSTLGLPREALVEWVIAHTEVSRSSIMGAQVERSAYTTTNPSLASEAQVITNADQSLIGALVAVEDALADLLDGGAGMIHVTAGLLTALQSGGGLRYDADGRPFTATGHLIVADAGYLGVSPATNDVVDGELWIYGSGPVFAKFDDELVALVGMDGSDIDLTRNNQLLSAIQAGIAIFEPCSVVAAQVDTSDDNIVGQSA